VKYQVNLFSEKLTLSQERPQITTNKLNTVIGLNIRIDAAKESSLVEFQEIRSHQ